MFPKEFYKQWYNTFQPTMTFISTAGTCSNIPVKVRGGRLLLGEEEWSALLPGDGQTPLIVLFEDVDHDLFRFRIRFFDRYRLEIRQPSVPWDKLPVVFVVCPLTSKHLETVVSFFISRYHTHTSPLLKLQHLELCNIIMSF